MLNDEMVITSLSICDLQVTSLVIFCYFARISLDYFLEMNWLHQRVKAVAVFTNKANCYNQKGSTSHITDTDVTWRDLFLYNLAVFGVCQFYSFWQYVRWMILYHGSRFSHERTESFHTFGGTFWSVFYDVPLTSWAHSPFSYQFIQALCACVKAIRYLSITGIKRFLTLRFLLILSTTEKSSC